MQVGDKVKYVPAECYAFNRNPNGGYPWDMGKKVIIREGGKVSEGVEKLTGKALEAMLSASRRGNTVRAVLMHPNCTWDAVVTSVNEDGTVNLDVQSNNGGVTLHENNVSISDGKEPDTCHA